MNCQAQATLLGAETSHAQLVSHTGGLPKLMSFMQGPEEGTWCALEEEGKRTSWIAIMQQLGFIYMKGVLLTKLLWSYLSNVAWSNTDMAWLLIAQLQRLTDVSVRVLRTSPRMSQSVQGLMEMEACMSSSSAHSSTTCRIRRKQALWSVQL